MSLGVIVTSGLTPDPAGVNTMKDAAIFVTERCFYKTEASWKSITISLMVVILICSALCWCLRENMVESQRSHMEEMQGTSDLLREEMRRKEEEYEERLLQVRQQQTSKLR